MSDFHIGLIGIIAAMCTTASFFPQIIKIFKTKHTKDISMGMYLVLAVGVVCWLIYGISIGELPIILANSFTIILCLTVIIAKIRYDRD